MPGMALTRIEAGLDWNLPRHDKGGGGKEESPGEGEEGKGGVGGVGEDSRKSSNGRPGRPCPSATAASHHQQSNTRARRRHPLLAGRARFSETVRVTEFTGSPSWRAGRGRNRWGRKDSEVRGWGEGGRAAARGEGAGRGEPNGAGLGWGRVPYDPTKPATEYGEKFHS